jgi:hypothetical protein
MSSHYNLKDINKIQPSSMYSDGRNVLPSLRREKAGSKFEIEQSSAPRLDYEFEKRLGTISTKSKEILSIKNRDVTNNTPITNRIPSNKN